MQGNVIAGAHQNIALYGELPLPLCTFSFLMLLQEIMYYTSHQNLFLQLSSILQFLHFQIHITIAPMSWVVLFSQLAILALKNNSGLHGASMMCSESFPQGMNSGSWTTFDI